MRKVLFCLLVTIGFLAPSILVAEGAQGKNPAEFVNVSFLKKLEKEGFFKKLLSGH